MHRTLLVTKDRKPQAVSRAMPVFETNALPSSAIPIRHPARGSKRVLNSRLA
jgi:hypothetical protein